MIQLTARRYLCQRARTVSAPLGNCSSHGWPSGSRRSSLSSNSSAESHIPCTFLFDSDRRIAGPPKEHNVSSSLGRSFSDSSPICGNVIARTHYFGKGIISNQSSLSSASAVFSIRQMSSSSSSNGQGMGTAGEIEGGAYPPVDESLAKIVPGFGSSPISAEMDAPMTSAAAIFEPTWWPSDQCLLLINYIQEASGLPYALAISATTVAFRILLFPLFVKGQRNASRMAHMQPEFQALKNQIDKMGSNVDQQAQMKYMSQTRALFKKYDCNPMMGLAAALFQAPVFISMFFALKKAPDFFPDLLSNGGLFWFTDLTAPDPYLIMPILSASTFLGMTEIGKQQMMASDPQRGQVMVNAFRALAVVMVPITMNFNSAVFVYWTVNNSFSLGQAILLKNNAVKKFFGIWDPPKPVPGQETKGFVEEIKSIMAKKEEQTNALSPERIKAHNEIIEQQKKVRKMLIEKEGLKGKGKRK